MSMNEASPWTPGYNVVGDKLQRNIFTNKVDQKSVTTACGNNLGKYTLKCIFYKRNAVKDYYLDRYSN